ncbi:uroporphyrinogen-III synthase [Luteimonas sp. e5]
MAVPEFLLVSLRPAGAHAGLRRAAARHGGSLFALSPWRIVMRGDAATRAALAQALAQPQVFFSSPAAVHAAAALQPLRAHAGQAVFAVGAGGRRALRRAGVAGAQAPARMDSEGLLALPAFAALGTGDALGLVTAPGGRGEIARRLRARGVRIVRADVYERVPLALPAARIARLQALLETARVPVFLALSSGEAFAQLLAQWPASALPRLQQAVTVIAASPRLAELARSHGFPRRRLAASALPADLVAAIVQASR